VIGISMGVTFGSCITISLLLLQLSSLKECKIFLRNHCLPIGCHGALFHYLSLPYAHLMNLTISLMILNPHLEEGVMDRNGKVYYDNLGSGMYCLPSDKIKIMLKKYAERFYRKMQEEPGRKK